MQFSDPDTVGPLEITPLAAAIVEAMPDRKLVLRIQRQFKQKGNCPPSAIFTAQEVESYYQQRKMNVKAVRLTKIS